METHRVIMFGIAIVLFIAFLMKDIFPSMFLNFFKRSPYLHFYFFPKKLNAEHQQILHQNFDFYRRLSPKYKKSFDHQVNQFLIKYPIIGRQNFEADNNVRLLIAGTFVMLTFGFEVKDLIFLRRILVYENPYYSQLTKSYHKGEFTPAFKTIVFSWKDFLHGLQVDNDSVNLGIHEFSHLLMMQERSKRSPKYFISFSEGFRKIEKLMNNQLYFQNVKNSLFFREYAFENKIEFVAVLLESFYENPQQLKTRFPDLYKIVVFMLGFRQKWFSH